MPSIQLNGLVLPPRAEFRRDIVSREELRGGDFHDKYDFHTLVYDAFYVPSRRATALICPPLLNLEPIMREARWSANGQPLRITALYPHKRFVEVWLRGADNPAELQFEYGDVKATIPVARAEPEAFENLRCVVTKSKNNDLLWIKDWAHYHVKTHGLEGVVLFDNASDRYSAEDVEAALNEVQGLKRVHVISAPYTFGPYSDSNARFLQVAMLNIARLRLLSKAAGVLSIDIDELVTPSPDGSVFETARRSPIGYTLFIGGWRYPEPGAEQALVRHQDHIYRQKKEKLWSWEARSGTTKYCICPKALAGIIHWDIHGSVRGSLKPLLVTKKVRFLHCRAISTSWKYDRKLPDRDALTIDQGAVAAYQAGFGASAG